MRPPRRVVLSLLVCGLWVGATASAQSTAAPQDPNQAKTKPGTERTFRGSCSTSLSRDLFHAADLDGDDRLDVFEAHDALESMRDLRDHDGFARLDRDRDGFVSWPEFDQCLQKSLQGGGTFKIHLVRKLTAVAPEARPATPLQKFLQLHDSNGNGELDPAEVDKFLRESDLSPTLGAQLKTLDHDRSGRIEEAELAPWFEQLPGRGPTEPVGPASPLPPPWSTADQNRDGVLDADEWKALLRRLDPTLDRVADSLRERLDLSRDGKLQADELPGRKPVRPAPPPRT
jgi:Ca2+-binding EF-hand superfamily protein